MLDGKNIGGAVGELIQLLAGDIAAREFAPGLHWRGIQQPEHLVQFYETDRFLLDSVGTFLGAGLSEGDACIVVATKAHVDGLDDRLQRFGVDPATARVDGRYVSLDATETLSTFMVDGLPEPDRFAEIIGAIIARVAGDGRPVRIFGEMVALLWAEGNENAAHRLEELWNDLRRNHSFSLLCAYPIKGFGGEELAGRLHDVCTAHSHIIPAESYSARANEDDRLRSIIRLQQKAISLEAEIAERKQAEAALRAAKYELEVQVEDLRRLHSMSVSVASSLDIASVLHEVLQAALEVQGTDMGLLSLCDSQRDGLNLKVQRGFDNVLEQVEWVPPGGGACGTCYEQRRRVVVEDVEADPIFAEYREMAKVVGFRACHSTPLFSRNGSIIGVLSVHFRHAHSPSARELCLMDLYARMAADSIENARLHRQMQQELEEREQSIIRERNARGEAEQANRLKDEFLATVSHELRTPLNAIIGWSHMVRSGNLDEATVARAIETIERNAKAQAQLIEDILDVSRVITGKLRLTIEPVDLASIINAAIDSVQLAADSKGIELEVTICPSARHVAGDSSRLQQIVWNLLSNAIKFTPTGGRVEVRLERAGTNAQIVVRDTGEGIKASFLPFIFDRFRQADGTTTRKHGGLGLGLAIVRHLVELHGGTIHAESPGEGAGSKFTITLPLAITTERGKDRRVGFASLWPSEDTDAQVKPILALDGVKVLLVDDDQDTLNMISAMLTECRAIIQTASSSVDALEALRWFKPDVIVSDLAMPYEDGYSLIHKLRVLGTESGKQTPAVALTAYVRVEDRARALSAGFNMFVPKPIEPDELITAIANLIEPGATELLLSNSKIM